jgi:hypothetical protein
VRLKRDGEFEKKGFNAIQGTVAMEGRTEADLSFEILLN